MREYHKIQTIFKRDMENKHKTLLEGQWTLPEFEYLQNNEWVFTEKVDGTNIRVMFDGDNVTFGGKTDNAQIPSSLVTRLNELFLTMERKSLMKSTFHASKEICLYGEGYGAKIQKGGGNYSPTQDFVLFDIRVGEWWLLREDVEQIAATLSLTVVPIISRGTLSQMIEVVKNGIKSQWGDFLAEGIVARPAVELRTRSNHRIITKLKTRDFVGVK